MGIVYRFGYRLNRGNHPMKPKLECGYAEIECLINSWVLSERNRNLMKRRLLDGIRFEKLAEEFDLSVRQTKNIVYKEQDVIFKHIKLH